MSEVLDKRELVPKLRFPEFQGKWTLRKLSDLTVEVSESVGDRKFTPVSISAGKGFVPQAEKFGRDISGEQYRHYTLVTEGMFVYNRGNSITFPQGCVYRYFGTDPVAAPAVFTCFRTNGEVIPELLQQFFAANLHGAQLSRDITSSARSNGLLNISDNTFFSLSVPLPSEIEQRKLADCLNSLDELITAEAEKLEALKRHKKGLLQQLFPIEGEAAPRLRFPQFSKAGDWLHGSIGTLGDVVTGTTPSTTNRDFYGRDVLFASPADISDHRIVSETANGLSTLGSKQSRLLPPGSTLFVCIGSTIGKVAQNADVCATNQQINSVVPDTHRFDRNFVYYLLLTKTNEIRELAGKQAVPLVSKTVFSSVEVEFPLIDEQRVIAALLNELDYAHSSTHHRLNQLRIHKAALMQQLFPSLDEADF